MPHAAHWLSPRGCLQAGWASAAVDHEVAPTSALAFPGVSLAIHSGQQTFELRLAKDLERGFQIARQERSDRRCSSWRFRSDMLIHCRTVEQVRRSIVTVASARYHRPGAPSRSDQTLTNRVAF